MPGRSQKPETNAIVQRIAQLSELDRDVANLLQSAGTAIKTLTSSAPESDEGQEDQIRGLDQRKEAFTVAISQYFALLASIDVRLRRQISALENAEIIPPELTAKESQPDIERSDPIARPIVPNKNTVTNGGLGDLDVGWLNSRNINIETIMEAELWAKAERLVQTLANERKTDDDHDVTMSHDLAKFSG
ncbi:MAG: hypothetical protein Q9170_000440 [Blastenia crenularia]